MLRVDHERGLREELVAIVSHPFQSDGGAGAGIVMPVDADEHHRPAPLGLRHLGVVLGEAEHRGHPAGVVPRGIEPAVAVRDDIDGLVGRAREGAPYERRLQVHPLC